MSRATWRRLLVAQSFVLLVMSAVTTHLGWDATYVTLCVLSVACWFGSLACYVISGRLR